MPRNLSSPLLFFAIGLLVFTSVIFVLYFDVGEVDDPDLAIPTRAVDSSRNPFPEIRGHELDANELAEFSRVKGMMLGSEKMDSAFIGEMLGRHRPLLDSFHRYSAMEEWQRDNSGGFRASHIYAQHWADIVPLILADSARLAGEAKNGEAIDVNLSILRFAARFQSGGTNFIEWVIARNIRVGAYRGLANLIDQVPLEHDELIGIAESIDSPAFRDEHFGLMLRIDYAETSDLITASANSLRTTRKSWIPHRALYKKNRTQHALAGNYRRTLALEGATLTDLSSYADTIRFREPYVEWLALLSGNREGDSMAHSFEISLLSAAEGACLHGAFREVLLSRIAMERYRLDHGSWPPDFAALVPGYLDAVPIDPVDGKPLRYDPSSKVIYSIGGNMRDEKGLAKNKGALRDRKEIVIELEPTEPVPWPDFKGNKKDERR